MIRELPYAWRGEPFDTLRDVKEAIEGDIDRSLDRMNGFLVFNTRTGEAVYEVDVTVHLIKREP